MEEVGFEEGFDVGREIARAGTVELFKAGRRRFGNFW